MRIHHRACLVAAGIAILPGMGRAEIDPSRYSKEVLASTLFDPMQCGLYGQGDILIAQIDGTLRRYHAESKRLETLGRVPVTHFAEVGMMGLALSAPDGDGKRRLFLMHCPEASEDHVLRVTEYPVGTDGIPDLESGAALLDFPIDLEGAVHMGGGLWFDDQSGELWIGTGDNSPPIPELPVDLSADGLYRDSLRTSGNTMDLRGKILRIRPDGKGGYSIPSGNLFPEGKGGRAEIFAMGVRNGFRLSFDPIGGRVAWGDVGQNIDPALGVGPNGYDEFNVTSTPGNFGWPMFAGPNEGYRRFDFATRQVGEPFNPEMPRNESPRNTGAMVLPPARPSTVHYPSWASDRFPILGSGGRSAMAGPFLQPKAAGELALPEELNGSLLVHDWTRNWIRAIQFGEDGEVSDILPVASALSFRKPIDLKLAADGTLYVLEYGDVWGGNRDGTLSRVVYQRGNRPPEARIVRRPEAGPLPLVVELDASTSSDPDGDPLQYEWRVGGASIGSGAKIRHEFTTAGRHELECVVTDASGASDHVVVDVVAGNSPPEIAIHGIRNGGFFDWGTTLSWQVDALDPEDGRLPPEQLSGEVRYRLRRSMETEDPGLALMRRTTCFSCHQESVTSVGPSYLDVSRRYAEDPLARGRLVSKVISGGVGTWGQIMMPPHPQHDASEVRLMVNWILDLASEPAVTRMSGDSGVISTGEAPVPVHAGGCYLVQFTGTDKGAAGVPTLEGEAESVLHARRRKAAFFDEIQGGGVVDVFEGAIGNVARLRKGGQAVLRDVDLKGIDRLRVRLSPQRPLPMVVEFRLDGSEGPLLGTIPIMPGLHGLQGYQEVLVPIPEIEGLHELVVRVVSEDPSDEDFVDIDWVEFLEKQVPKPPEEGVTRLLLIPTQLDHPWGTHMYSSGLEALAGALKLVPKVEAVVCPDFDWPDDPAWLEGVDGLVYYSRPAGDILLDPKRREQVEKLMKDGVGLSVIHWATGCSDPLGEHFLEMAGGWWSPPHSGLAMAQTTMHRCGGDHPVSQGLEAYEGFDEIYLNMKFHEDSDPLVKVTLKGVDGAPDGDQVVSWALEREDGGRSFGCTLGHFQYHFTQGGFLRYLTKGVLWSADYQWPEP